MPVYVKEQQKNNLPVTELKGVGAAVAERLAKLNIYTVQDLLFHLPLRYQDRTRVYPIGSLRAGNEGIIEGTVQLSEIKFARKRMLLSRISDGTGAILLRFFHFSNSQKNNLAPGVRVRCFGEARYSAAGLEMVHPEYQIIRDDNPVAVNTALTAVYPTTEGLQQRSIYNLVSQAVALLESGKIELDELVPAELFKQDNVPTLKESI
ncbi:MAG: ATP-dependent DNA helicase RecG, partial [Gammaproteobacteria bacterium]|nr:ATP-dependent DNA helicase RecG [Gammaproteobacteria bacterium]